MRTDGNKISEAGGVHGVSGGEPAAGVQVQTPGAGGSDQRPEHFERPESFGRVRWWYEESPMAFTTSAALFLVLCGLVWLLTARGLRADLPPAVVSLQPVQDEPTEGRGQQPAEEVQSVDMTALAGDAVERTEEQVEPPPLPTPEPAPDVEKLTGNLKDDKKAVEQTEAALGKAGSLLGALVPGKQGDEGQGGPGVGNLDPDSTAGRQARWVITYPPLPEDVYARMLDFFGIELAYLLPDRKTMQYLARFSGRGRKYRKPEAEEDRLPWLWMGDNRLQRLDEQILRRHGLEPTSQVVQLYPKRLEEDLSRKEKQYMRRRFKNEDVSRIASTEFEVFADGHGGWYIKVTGMSLK